MYLFDITGEEVHKGEGPDNLGVVLAEAAAHLAPGVQFNRDIPKPPSLNLKFIMF